MTLFDTSRFGATITSGLGFFDKECAVHCNLSFFPSLIKDFRRCMLQSLGSFYFDMHFAMNTTVLFLHLTFAFILLVLNYSFRSMLFSQLTLYFRAKGCNLHLRSGFTTLFQFSSLFVFACPSHFIVSSCL